MPSALVVLWSVVVLFVSLPELVYAPVKPLPVRLLVATSWLVSVRVYEPVELLLTALVSVTSVVDELVSVNAPVMELLVSVDVVVLFVSDVSV